MGAMSETRPGTGYPGKKCLFQPHGTLAQKGHGTVAQLTCVSVLQCACCVVAVLGMQCYQCDSNTNPDCTEWFDHDHKDTLTVRSTECEVDSSKFCVKTTGVWGGRSLSPVCACV